MDARCYRWNRKCSCQTHAACSWFPRVVLLKVCVNFRRWCLARMKWAFLQGLYLLERHFKKMQLCVCGCVCGVFASACMPECRCLWSPVAGVAGGQKTVGRFPAAGVASCCDSPSVGARALKSWGISSVPGGTKSCLGLFSPLLSASCLLRGKRQSVSCSAALLFCPTTWAKRPGTVPSEKASQKNHLLS